MGEEKGEWRCERGMGRQAEDGTLITVGVEGGDDGASTTRATWC